MSSIRDGGNKIKALLEDWVGQWGMPLLVVLVGVISFGLGRISMLEETRPAVSIHQAAVAASPALPEGGMFVASRTGTVYYYPWCAGALKISVKDQLWFSSEVLAQKAGLRPAKNCKGLGS